MFKQLFSFLAIALTFIAFWPYIRSIQKGQTKPHYFSWVIWGTSTVIAFLAQLAGLGGVGAWPTGVSGLVTIYVAYVAYTKKADILITKTDWAFFAICMLSVPFWYFTANPLWAILSLTAIDTLGLAPTIRKTYAKPYEENLTFYALITLRNLLSIVALQHYSITTVLFPGVMSLGCILFIVIILYRRTVVTKPAHSHGRK